MTEPVSTQVTPETIPWAIKYLRPIITINMLLLLNAIVILAFVDPQKAASVAKTLTSIPDYVWGVVGGTLGAHFLGRTLEKVKGVA